VSFAPVAPSGWPSAIAPPFTFTMVGSMSSSRITASACAANASLNSMSFMSCNDSPARVSAFGIAWMGPTPMMSGATPAVANDTNRASGRRPNASARSRRITSTAAAPSE
jgi:hypothetical protein